MFLNPNKETVEMFELHEASLCTRVLWNFTIYLNQFDENRYEYDSAAT